MKFFERKSQIQNLDWSLIRIQTIITLFPYYYIALKSDQIYLWWMLEDGFVGTFNKIGFLHLFIPLFIPWVFIYYKIRFELNKTEYDLDQNKNVKKSIAVDIVSKDQAFYYYCYGLIGVAIIDFVLCLLIAYKEFI